MGAMEFSQRAKGKNAAEAFNQAVREARWEHGNAGYTGTIAEKYEFTEIPVPQDRDPREFADELMEKDDPRIKDKWGPAGCVKIAEGEYLFFGLASS